jgi:hypothetical protein
LKRIEESIRKIPVTEAVDEANEDTTEKVKVQAAPKEAEKPHHEEPTAESVAV